MLLHAPKVQTNCREFLSCSPLWSVTANAEHTTAHTRKHLSIMRFSSRRTSKTIASNKLSYLLGALNFTGSFQFLTLMEIELYLPKQRGGIAKGIKGIYIWQGHKESICSKWRVEGRCLRGTLNGALSSSHSRLVSWLSSRYIIFMPPKWICYLIYLRTSTRNKCRVRTFFSRDKRDLIIIAQCHVNVKGLSFLPFITRCIWIA